MQVFLVQRGSEFAGEEWYSPSRSLPPIPECEKHGCKKWTQTHGLCLQRWEPFLHSIAIIFLPNHAWKITSLLKNDYFKKSWTLICLMLPCHRWCVSPDALAQEMGRRCLIYLCQASSTVTFVRGYLSDSLKTPDCLPRIPCYGQTAHTSICHQWFVCFSWNGQETNLEGSRYPNYFSDQHFTMRTGMFAASFCVASSLGGICFLFPFFLLPRHRPLGSVQAREGA